MTIITDRRNGQPNIRQRNSFHLSKFYNHEAYLIEDLMAAYYLYFLADIVFVINLLITCMAN